jgi:predicted nucleic acid-binding Zn ribbon protein
MPFAVTCYSDSVIRASQVIPAVVEEVVRKAPLTPEKVAFAWRMAVGPAVGKATSVRLGDNGLLYVTCESASWAAAVKRSTPLIHQRLDALLGAEAVKALHFNC